jgi:transposase InsO family protein
LIGETIFHYRIVGWSMANHLRTEFVLDVLEMAIQRRQPSDVIHQRDVRELLRHTRNGVDRPQ